MVRAGHGRGMASVNHTRAHCVNQMGKTHSKPLASRHGRGTAWARHAMCESALIPHKLLASVHNTVVNAFKSTINFKTLRPGWQLELKLPTSLKG
jgi:hypothetical protein